MQVNSYEFWDTVRQLLQDVDDTFRESDFFNATIAAERNEKPDIAKSFPGIKVGDNLYSCRNLQEGVETFVVVAVDNEGFVRVINFQKYGLVLLNWGENFHYRTPEESLKCCAEREIKLHKPCLDRAEYVLKEIKNGNITYVMNGVELSSENKVTEVKN